MQNFSGTGLTGNVWSKREVNNEVKLDISGVLWIVDSRGKQSAASIHPGDRVRFDVENGKIVRIEKE